MLSEPIGTRMVLTDVLKERERQDAKWGEQNHNPYIWIAVLGEEVGEVSKAALQTTFGGMTADEYRDELIQVAAVAVAAIESLDRNGWPS